MTSNVYFFQHTTLPLVKIGKADDWAIRALQVGGVELIDFERSMFKEVSDSTTAYDLERMLHVMFENRRVSDPTGLSGGTEWFCETVMGEVRKVVRGLSTCDGLTKIKKVKQKKALKAVKIGRREAMRRMKDNMTRTGTTVDTIDRKDMRVGQQVKFQPRILEGLNDFYILHKIYTVEARWDGVVGPPCEMGYIPSDLTWLFTLVTDDQPPINTAIADSCDTPSLVKAV